MALNIGPNPITLPFVGTVESWQLSLNAVRLIKENIELKPQELLILYLDQVCVLTENPNYDLAGLSLEQCDQIADSLARKIIKITPVKDPSGGEKGIDSSELKALLAAEIKRIEVATREIVKRALPDLSVYKKLIDSVTPPSVRFLQENQKFLNRIQSPYLDTIKSIQRVTRLVSPEILHLSNSANDIAKRYANQIDTISKLTGSFRTQFRSPVQELIDTTKLLSDHYSPPNIKALNSLKKISNSHSLKISNSSVVLSALSPISTDIAPGLSSIIKTIYKDHNIIDSLSQIAQTAPENAPEISVVNSEVTIDGETATNQQILNGLNEISSKLDAQKFSSWDDLFKSVTLPKAVAKIIEWILCAVIAILLSHAADTFSLNAKPDLKLVEKQCSASVVQLSNEEVSNLRFVRIRSGELHVRTDPSMKGEIIDFLYLGDVVEIIEKQKRWSLVCYKAPYSDEILAGWVNNNYLRRLR